MKFQKSFLNCLASACRASFLDCHPIVPNKTGHIEIIFKLANDCREVPFSSIVSSVSSITLVATSFYMYLGTGFLRVIYSILNASAIRERNENLLARNETRLAGNETRLARNETRGGNLHLSGTVYIVLTLINNSSSLNKGNHDRDGGLDI